MAIDPKQLAKRFAKSFHEVYLEMEGEKGILKVRKQMEDLLELSRGEVGIFFANPVFSADEKIVVLKKFLEKNKTEDALVRFLELLISLRSLHLLPEILKAYDETERERKNEAEALITTAFPLTKDEQTKIASALSKATGKNVLLNVETDKSLIGGLVAKVGSVVYDASVLGYINRMQQEF